MSVTAANRNGTSPPSDVEGVLQELRGISERALGALSTIEQQREQIALRHVKEREALRLEYADKREALSAKHKREVEVAEANAKLLRGALRPLGVTLPPRTKLGARGKPLSMTAVRTAPSGRKLVSVPTAETQRSVITALLHLTKDGEETSVPDIMKIRMQSQPISATNNGGTYNTLKLLRTRELVRKSGVRKVKRSRPTQLWSVWDRKALMQYLEELDA